MEVLKKPNLVRTISLKESDNRFQLVYATQLYGSLFALTARFQTEKLENGNIMIRQIDFVGVNYKGPLNLGIINLEVKKVPSNKLEKGFLVVNITLQANDAMVFSREISKKGLDIEVDCSNDEKKMLKIHRSLAPMYEGNSDKIEDQAFVHGKFDSEFFERDGVYVKRKEKDHENQFEETDVIEIPEFSDPTNRIKDIFGPRCVIGESLFIFS
ncbi:MAG: hypothetical protein HRT61_13240 [Ekhidna sp.]|nr:hypothetical protein [Ekhidna sp.]